MKKEIPKCMWCGKTYEEHSDFYPENKPKVPCLLYKGGFLQKKDKCFYDERQRVEKDDGSNYHFKL